MKKISLIIAMLFFSGSLFAQIQFESDNLENVLLKAKKENKICLIIGSKAGG